MKKPAKEYNLQWLSLKEAKINYTKQVVTNDPKMRLFDEACAMIIMCNSIFGHLSIASIVKNIKNGSTNREHFWLEYPNGEVLSIMETVKHN